MNTRNLFLCSLIGLVSFSELAISQTSQTVTYTYTANGEIETIDGPRTDVSDVTTYTYDPNGNVSTITNALGHQIQWAGYNGLHLPVGVIDSNGVETQFTYTAQGWLANSTIKHPSGNSSLDITTTYQYDALGQVTRITQATGAYLAFSYDAAKRLTDIEDHLGNSINYTLDNAGNRQSETVRNNANVITRSVNRTFDELSRLMAVTGTANQSTQFGHDVNGNKTEIIDGKLNTTGQAFDGLNRLVTITEPTGGEISMRYDNEDRLVSVIDQRGLETTYTYNDLGNLVTLASPDTGVKNYTYDNAGNLIQTVDARGVSVAYTYDALNRLTSIAYPGNTDENISFGYDIVSQGNFGSGKLTSITDASGQTDFTYDYLGNIAQEQYTIETQSYTLHFGYDSYGRIESITYPSGRIVTYVLDSEGRITGITTQANQSSPSENLISNANYLPFGPLTSFTYGNNVQHTIGYDLDYRVQSIQSLGVLAIMDRQYEYDANNNIIDITKANQSFADQWFNYDVINRVTDASGDFGTLTYSYDLAGNRLTRETSNGSDSRSETYSYSSSSNQLSSVAIDDNGIQTTRSLNYDSNGNLIEDQNGVLTSTTYDQSNRPTATTNTTGNIQYVHNSRGLRTVKSSAYGVEHYHYDQSGQLIAVTDANGSTVQEYIYLGNLVVGVVQNGVLYFAHNDHLATVQQLVDTNGDIVWQVEAQTPFGQTQVNEDVDGDGEAVTMNLRFPGQYFDQETGLHYNWHRYYDPSTGRYTQSDPIGILRDYSDPVLKFNNLLADNVQAKLDVSEGLNHLYGYSDQNPVVKLDRNGLQTSLVGNLNWLGEQVVTDIDGAADAASDAADTTGCVLVCYVVGYASSEAATSASSHAASRAGLRSLARAIPVAGNIWTIIGTPTAIVECVEQCDSDQCE